MLKTKRHTLNRAQLMNLPSLKAASISEDFKAFDIREYQGLRWIRIPEGMVQSVMLLEEPAYPLLDYIQAMLCSVLFVRRPGNLLNLGLGAGAIERFLLTQLSDIALVSVEIDTRMIEIARDYFRLPQSHPVVAQSAQGYLETNQQRFDILLSDICTRQGAANSQLTSDFITHAARAINRGGVVAINLIPNGEAEVVEVLIALRSTFPWILIYDVPDADNMILFCTAQPSPLVDELTQRAAVLHQATGLDLSPICSRLIRLPVKQSFNPRRV
jgi:spermidine synthase